jgi:hypothetical protein
MGELLPDTIYKERASVNNPSTLGWVDIRIGSKGKRRFVVSLARVWEIAKKVSEINRP